MDTTGTRTTARASALPPDERRAAIVAAVRPLLLEHGTKVTTKQIADAAGIAEGTVFRAFRDKDELLRAVVEAALDTSSLDATIASIDPCLPLEARMAVAVEALQRRIADVWRLLSAIDDVTASRARPPASRPEIPALVQLLDADRDRLRHDPVDAARALQALTFAVSHPALAPDGPMPPADVVDLLLDGIRSRPAPTPTPKARRR